MELDDLNMASDGMDDDFLRRGSEATLQNLDHTETLEELNDWLSRSS